MSEPRPPTLRAAIDAALVALGDSTAGLRLIESDLPRGSGAAGFAARFPMRASVSAASGAEALREAARLARSGAPVVVLGRSAQLLGDGYRVLREEIVAARLPVTLVADPAPAASATSAGEAPMIEDIGVARAFPTMTVVLPSDGREAASALTVAVALEGPFYLRIASDWSAEIGAPPFELGRAPELANGDDLTIASAGPPLARALEASRELRRVGIGARVLDLASVKPFDEKAILRAARATGAILTLEEHSVLTGLGSLVAAVTAEEHPVPVRRMGAPDLLPASPPDHDPYGLSLPRVLEEAHELLRARGKVQ